MKKWVPELEIRFAARSGFLTHDLWLKHFAGDHDRTWNHRRWANMVRDGYFFTADIAHSSPVLSLNPNSLVVRKFSYGTTARLPFGSQIRHDELLFDGLLNLQKEQLVRDYLTEADLKAVEAKGLKTVEEIKLPDLLIASMSGKRLAIEVEATAKSRRRYFGILNAYRSRGDIDAVLFAVPNSAVMRKIMVAAKEAMFPLDRIPVAFLSLDSWKTDTATREIKIGRVRETLKAYMHEHQQHTGTNVADVLRV